MAIFVSQAVVSHLNIGVYHLYTWVEREGFESRVSCPRSLRIFSLMIETHNP